MSYIITQFRSYSKTMIINAEVVGLKGDYDIISLVLDYLN